MCYQTNENLIKAIYGSILLCRPEKSLQLEICKAINYSSLCLHRSSFARKWQDNTGKARDERLRSERSIMNGSRLQAPRIQREWPLHAALKQNSWGSSMMDYIHLARHHPCSHISARSSLVEEIKMKFPAAHKGTFFLRLLCAPRQSERWKSIKDDRVEL